MPHLNDRVKETTSTTGTGAITLGGAPVGFQTFAQAFDDQDDVYYAIVGLGTGEWEVGIGRFNSGGGTIDRNQVLQSSNADALVNFSAGNKDVFCTIASFYAMNLGSWLALNSGTFFL